MSLRSIIRGSSALRSTARSPRILIIAAALTCPSAVSETLSNQERLWDIQPIIVSYYWPILRLGGDLSSLSMTTPNVIDVLAGAEHGAREVRKYWANNGKVLLNRVYPFRSLFTEEDLYKYFAANMHGAAGISIDEVVAHNLTQGQRDILARVLRKVRWEFPQQFIFVWDASRWDESNSDLLRVIRDDCDVVLLEVYIPEGRRKVADFAPFLRRRDELERYAPGMRGKTILAIGAHNKMRDGDDSTFGEHIAQQVKFIGRSLRADDLRGLAIYAPLYLTAEEQRLVDSTIRDVFFVDGAHARAK